MRRENKMKPVLKESYGLYIGGQWQPASDKGEFEAKNPATGFYPQK